VAITNSAAKPWSLRDYATKWAGAGRDAYQEGLNFAELYGLPLGATFALLAGVTCFSNCQEPFVGGDFKVKDRGWAEAVAGLYGPVVGMAPQLKSARFIEACMGVCRVKGFDGRRLLNNAQRCREKLVPYSTKDAYLGMLEEVYNFGRQQKVGLKAEATMAMRGRNVGHKPKAEDDAA
jgi:hypothetical protein